MIDQIKFNICTIRTPPNASMQGIVISSVFSRYIIVAYMLSSRESTLDNFGVRTFGAYQVAFFQLHEFGCAHVFVDVIVVREDAFAVD
jgi:hypothetical protein